MRLLGEAEALARQGVLDVEPNPPVGALLVRDGAIVGRGFHAFYGGPHAEVAAIADAGGRARGATLIVTLEPCSTTGKTPPCTEAIRSAGIARVVFGASDPNPIHAGRAAEALRAAGIEVQGPVHGTAENLIQRFRRHCARTRAWVIAKWAMSVDGKIAAASGASRWITGEAARAEVHALRGRVDAIAVGRRTIDVDNPSLTARPVGTLRAARVVFDRGLSMRRDWRGLGDGGPPVIAVHGSHATADRIGELRALGVRTIAAEDADAGTFVRSALVGLRAAGFQRILVEGGPTLLGSFFDARLVDQVLAFVAPRILGGAGAPSAVAGTGEADPASGIGLVETRFDRVGDDVAIRGFVRDAAD